MFKASRQINIDGIPVTFYKSKKARSINITIKPFRGVRVAVPWYTTYKQAIGFVSQKLDKSTIQGSRSWKSKEQFLVGIEFYYEAPSFKNCKSNN